METKEAQEAAQEQNNARAEGNPERRASPLERISFTRITDTRTYTTQGFRFGASTGVPLCQTRMDPYERNSRTCAVACAHVGTRAGKEQDLSVGLGGSGRRQWGWEGVSCQCGWEGVSRQCGWEGATRQWDWQGASAKDLPAALLGFEGRWCLLPIE